MEKKFWKTCLVNLQKVLKVLKSLKINDLVWNQLEISENIKIFGRKESLYAFSLLNLNLKGHLGSPVSDEKPSLLVSWDPPSVTKNHHFQSVGIPPQWRKIITSSQLGYPISNEKSTLPVSWRMADDKAGQVQSELSAGGTKRDFENTPKCTRPNCILVRRSSLGPPPVGRHRT